MNQLLSNGQSSIAMTIIAGVLLILVLILLYNRACLRESIRLLEVNNDALNTSNVKELSTNKDLRDELKKKTNELADKDTELSEALADKKQLQATIDSWNATDVDDETADRSEAVDEVTDTVAETRPVEIKIDAAEGDRFTLVALGRGAFNLFKSGKLNKPVNELLVIS
jgi:septal ring factor EnvC (AmiA/AmiB activator)